MIQTLLIFFGIYAVSFVLGYLISDKLTRPFGLFDVYPFKCRKCCTTWLMVALYAVWMMMDWNLYVFGASILIIAMNIAAFIYDERERGQIEYEEGKEERNRRYEDSKDN